MKLKYVLLTVLICLPFLINAQYLTQKEAINFAKKLYEVEILSEKGKMDLIKRIKRKKLKRLVIPNIFVTKKEYTSGLSHAQLLYYCYEAFYNETAFRLGFTDYNRLSEEIIRSKLYRISEEYRTLDSTFNADYNTFEGVIIERQINPNRRESHHGINYYLKPPYRLTKLKGEYGLIHPNRSATGQHIEKTIYDLIKIGLIDTAQNQLRNCDWGIEYSSLHCLYMNTIEEEDKTRNKAKSRTYLETIWKADIITEERLEQVIELERQGKLYEKMNIYEYCKNGIVVDFDYNLSIDSFYQNLFKELKRIIPNFDYQDLKIIKEQDKYHSYISLQFSINRIIYRSSRVRYSDKENWNQASIKYQFFKGIEQYLRDINSDKRLYYSISQFSNFSDDYNYIGFILLTKNQNTIFYGDYCWDNYDNTFTTKHINETLQLYKEIGLFNHLTVDEIERGENRLKYRMIYDYGDILISFPGSYYYSSWNLEYYQNPCEEVINFFNNVSKEFTPIYIEDVWEQYYDKEQYDSIYCSFQFNGQVYKHDELTEYGLGDEMIKLIQKAMKKNKVNGNIHPIFGDAEIDDSGIFYIFLTTKQYKILRELQPELFELY